MIAVDTNLLVLAHRRDSPHHEAAHEVVRDLVEGRNAWALPWPCVHEFFAIATHPRIYAPPSTAAQALRQIDAWLGSPSLFLLAEGPDYVEELKRSIVGGHIVGPRVHDARIAALCLQHGVRELLTFDRDFSRFPAVKTRNPLVRAR
jgi:uncharacterized protein